MTLCLMKWGQPCLTLSASPAWQGPCAWSATVADIPVVLNQVFSWPPTPFLDPAARQITKMVAQLGPVALPVQHYEQKVLMALNLLTEL